MNSIFRRFLPQGARYYTSGRQSEAKTRTVWGELSSLGWTFMVTYSICFQLRAFVGGVSKCEGPSMLPTLDNNVVIYERYSVRRWELHHGDVVLLRSPEKWKGNVCKRIVGVAGDTVYFEDKFSKRTRKAIVPEGHVFLMGDNSKESHDSRTYGAVPAALIFGRVFCKLTWRGPQRVNADLAYVAPHLAPPELEN
eukprot:Rmarinus@m.26518